MGIKRFWIFGIAAVGIGVFALARAANIRESQPPPSPSPYVPKDYTLLFFDEFLAEGLNSTHWQQRFTEGHPYDAGVISHNSVRQPGDGYLYLISRYENEQLLTGMIRSRPQFQYGYFEARIRFQQLQGHHGAFWLHSETYGAIEGDPGQSGAEIDIIEFFGNGRIPTDAEQNVYYDPYLSPEERAAGIEQPGDTFEVFYRNNHTGTELSGDFHVFGLLWTEQEYIFFIDGEETWRTRAGLSHTEEYIILSLAASEWENNARDVLRFPDQMLVDYVRVYTNERERP